MRHEYRVLSDDEKNMMQSIKDKGLELHELIESIGNPVNFLLPRRKLKRR